MKIFQELKNDHHFQVIVGFGQLCSDDGKGQGRRPYLTSNDKTKLNNGKTFKIPNQQKMLNNSRQQLAEKRKIAQQEKLIEGLKRPVVYTRRPAKTSKTLSNLIQTSSMKYTTNACMEVFPSVDNLKKSLGFTNVNNMGYSVAEQVDISPLTARLTYLQVLSSCCSHQKQTHQHSI